MNRLRYSPSALKVYSQGCPRALDFYQERTDGYSDQYAVGNAAHAVLEAIGLAAKSKADFIDPAEARNIAEWVCAGLITNGKRGDNVPLPPEEVFQGRDLALRYAELYPLDPQADYETGAAFTKDWARCKWDALEARFRLVFDVMVDGEDGDEESSFAYTLARDYKSAWPTDESELDTVQMHSQAVAAAIVRKEHSIIRQEIVNLRTTGIFKRDIPTDDDTLRSWRKEIELVMAAADAQAEKGARPARVGERCTGCAYIGQCEAAQEVFTRKGIDTDPVAMAERLAVAEGMKKALQPKLRAHVTANGPVQLANGTVGMKATESRSIGVEGAKTLFDLWEQRGGDVAGFLTALGGLPVTAVENNLLKVMHPVAGKKEAKAERDAIMERIVTLTPKSEFDFGVVLPKQDHVAEEMEQ